MTAQISLTREQSRLVDSICINDYHIPGLVLMENAAASATKIALDMLTAQDLTSAKVLIICGGGNNGGDGFAIARMLHEQGYRVHVIHHKPAVAYHGDAAANFAIAKSMGLALTDAYEMGIQAYADHEASTLVIDALLGTGLTGQVKPPLDEVISWMNRHPAPVLSIDIPSGLDCDTGEPLGIAVQATRTITFATNKVGFTYPRSAVYLGELSIGDIGVPPQVIDQILNMPAT